MQPQGSIPKKYEFGKLANNTGSGNPSALPTGSGSLKIGNIFQGTTSGVYPQTDSRDLIQFHNPNPKPQSQSSPGKPTLNRPNKRPQMTGAEKAAKNGAVICADGSKNPFNKGINGTSSRSASIFDAYNAGIAAGLTSGVSTGYSSLAGLYGAMTPTISISTCNNKMGSFEKAMTALASTGLGPVLGQALQNAFSGIGSAIGGLFGGDSSSDITSNLSSLSSSSDKAFEGLNSNDPQVRQNALLALEEINSQYGTMAESIHQKAVEAEQTVKSKESAYEGAKAKTQGIKDNISNLEAQLADAPEDKKKEIQEQIDSLRDDLEEAQDAENKAKEELDAAKNALATLEQQTAQFVAQQQQFSQRYDEVVKSRTKSGINASA